MHRRASPPALACLKLDDRIEQGYAIATLLGELG
jgi:hypothetical protein